jgi:Transposase-associated domain
MFIDRGWMYKDRCLPNGKLDPQYVRHVDKFVNEAYSKPSVVTVIKGQRCIPCPCTKCQNLLNRDEQTVKMHLYRLNFMEGYEHWYKHDEPYPNFISDPPSQIINNDMEDMIKNVAGPDFNWDARCEDEAPTEEAKQFFDMLHALEEPLWEINYKGDIIIKSNQFVLSVVTV